MTVETATYIPDLDVLLPDHDDFVAEGDNHIRLLKLVLKNQFPNLTAAVTVTPAQINFLAGVTSSVLHTAQKAAMNGVASLDVNTKIPAAQIPLATEAAVGGLEIATQAEALAGTLNDKIITPLKLAQAFAAGLPIGGGAGSFTTLSASGAFSGATTGALGTSLMVGSGSGLNVLFTNDRIQGRNVSAPALLRLQAGAGDLQIGQDAGARILFSVAASQLQLLGGAHLHVTGETAVSSLASSGPIIAPELGMGLTGNRGLQVGLATALNLAFNGNQIQQRNNGGVSTLFVNLAGGDLQVGPSAGGRILWDNTSKIFYVADGATLVAQANATINGTLNAGAVTIVGVPVVPQTRQVATATGLTGGGDLSANRTIALNFNALTAAAFDATYEAALHTSGGNHFKMPLRTLTQKQRVSVTSGGTTVASNIGKILTWDSASGGTIALGAPVADGDEIWFQKNNTGDLTITGATFVVGGDNVIAERGGIAIAKSLNGLWTLTGDLQRTGTITANGYMWLDKHRRLVMQWGTVQFAGATTLWSAVAVTFPVAFTTLLSLTEGLRNTDALSLNYGCNRKFSGSVSNTGFSAAFQKLQTAGTFVMNWVAVGII